MKPANRLYGKSLIQNLLNELGAMPQDMAHLDAQIAGAALESGFFESDFYLEKYPDVAKSETDPVLHYIRCGYREGRLPGEWADAKAIARMLAEGVPAADCSFAQFLEKWLGAIDKPEE